MITLKLVTSKMIGLGNVIFTLSQNTGLKLSPFK